MRNTNNSAETKDLKKKIATLENKLKGRVSKKDLNDREKLIIELKEKEEQIVEQKNELEEKQIQLEESRDKYADLYDFAPIGYLTIDRKGIIKEINITGGNILGYERKYILGLPFFHFLLNKQSKRFFNHLNKCRELKRLMVDDFQIKNKNNENLHTQITSIPAYNYNNNDWDFRISIIDITEKKKIEDELKESEKRFRLMADVSPSMIWMLDKNNLLEYANKTNLEFLGKNFEEIKGEKFFEVIHPEDRNKFCQALKNASKGKNIFNIEIRKLNKSGLYRWVLNTAAPRWLPDGKFQGFIGSAIDVTERREIREGLENSLKEKEILIKEVHHRVKNNLQIISSILSLQSYYTKNKPIEDILKGCKQRVLSMSLIHEQLYHTDDLVNINIKNYVNALIDNLSQTYGSSENHINFNLDFDDVSFNLETSINLGLILNELISNSLKYAFGKKDEGEIYISLKQDNPLNRFTLKVADNGRGLPDKFNLNNLNSLGLELVCSLVQQLHGQIEINKNGYTEFEIVINI